jgi:hypothetical protein
MAKQTFTTGQVLTAAQMTSLQQTAMGGGSATAKTASYTLVAADAGTTVIMNSASSTTITVNTALFAAGDTVLIVNQGAGVCTVTAGTATVNTAGALTLSQYETGQLYFLSTSAAIFSEYTQASSGGGITQLATGTLSGSTTTISSISQSYKSLQLIVFNVTATADYGFQISLNSISSNYSLRGYAASLFTGSGSVWGFNPASSFKSNDTANRFTMNIPLYTSASPVAFMADCTFSFLQDDNTTRFAGAATLTNSSVSAAITSISIVTGSTFNGGTYILNGIS